MTGLRTAIFVLLAFLLIAACNLASKKEDAAPLSCTLCYLTENTIYRMSPGQGKVDIVYSCPEARPGESLRIYQLARGPGGTLRFRITRTTAAEERGSIVTYDPKTGRAQPLIDVPDGPFSFPVISPDDSRVAMAIRSSFAIKDLRKNRITYYDEYSPMMGMLYPYSWSPEGRLLALSGGAIGKESTIYLFDTEKNTFAAWRTGSQPHFSPNGKRIAYLTPGNRRLVISDMDGNTLQVFEGALFKDLNGWIGEDRILLTVSAATFVHPYRNRIGIADLRTKKLTTIPIPTRNEIHGIVAECEESGRRKTLLNPDP